MIMLPENMLHHVKVGRDIFKMSRLMMVQHLVHEVDVPEVVAGPRLVLDLEAVVDNLLHHVSPAVVSYGNYQLVNVQQSDVLVPGNN